MAATPTRLLRVNVASVAPQANWPTDGSPYANYPYRWTVVLDVMSQLHSSPLTRAPYVYNGDDILVGDWLSNSLGGFVWQINSIVTHSANRVTCVVEDIKQFNTYADPTSSGDGSPPALVNGFVFVTTGHGYPILTPMTPEVLIPQWETEILSRFLRHGISGGPGVSVGGGELTPGAVLVHGVHGTSRVGLARIAGLRLIGVEGEADAGTPTIDVMSLQVLSTSGGNIVDDGTPVMLKAINWYGLENILIPQGLWQRPYKTITVQTIEYEGLLDQIKRLGFNCIRMPICEDITLPGRVVDQGTHIDPLLNPDLFASPPPQGATEEALRAFWRPCIEILDRIVEYAASIGLRIIFDMHCLAPDIDSTMGSGGLWYTTGTPTTGGASAGISREPRDETQWIAAWSFLADRYLKQPAVCGFDLMNEPYLASWDKDPNTGWPAAAERFAAQIQAINPNILIIVEGIAGSIDFTSVGGQSWNAIWGANLTGVSTRPVVLSVTNQLVYSPHEFSTIGAGNPPWLTDPQFPDFMPGIWDTAWGYIARQNIAPIWIGEFGANFETPTDIDTQWIAALNDYILNHNLSWAYWALPPGGTPTGILQADDWVTVIQAKLDAIAPILEA